MNPLSAGLARLLRRGLAGLLRAWRAPRTGPPTTAEEHALGLADQRASHCPPLARG